MALARGNSMGISGLRRAQSLAERRRQPSAAAHGQIRSPARSMAVYVEQKSQQTQDPEQSV